MFEKRLHTNTNTNTNTAHNMQKVKLIDMCGIGMSHLTSTCFAVYGRHSLPQASRMTIDHLTSRNVELAVKARLNCYVRVSCAFGDTRRCVT